ncbi:MAG TPA: hypothetical protein VEQ85_08400, partial [Lacipirellulaceae bacterium]|nr:hypothetical protein [Lacipirellulaceae bacterium]
MLRQCAYVKLLALLAALTAGVNPAWAVLRVTNGGFDSQGANVHLNSTLTPDGWFSGSLLPNTQSDTLINSQNGTLGRWIGNAHMFGNSTPFANDGTSETGYIYQSLGTYAGEASISVRGYVFNRTNPANLVGNFDVAVYATGAGAFEGANGSDINAAVFPVGAAAPTVFTQGTDFQITTGVNPQRAQWTYTATLTGAANPGDTIWLRIGDGGNPGNVAADEPIIDDVTVLQGANGFDLGDSDGDGDADLTDFANIRNNFRATGIPIA